MRYLKITERLAVEPTASRYDSWRAGSTPTSGR